MNENLGGGDTSDEQGMSEKEEDKDKRQNGGSSTRKPRPAGSDPGQ